MIISILVYSMANNSGNDSHLPAMILHSWFPPSFLIPVFIFNILLLVAIITGKKIPATVRLILSNIVASSEVVIIGLFVLNCYNLVNNNSSENLPSDFTCRLSYVVITSGAAGRFLFMAMYAVTVYILARYAGKNLRVLKLRFWHALLAVVGIWMFATSPNMVLWSDVFLNVAFRSNATCTPHGNSNAGIVSTFGYIIMYGLCSFIISIIFPILTVQYVKKNSISGNKPVLKSMMKFSIFLLIGNSIHLMNIAVTNILAAFTPFGEENEAEVVAFGYVEGTFLLLSLVTSPILIIIYFKNVRQRLERITCFICTLKKRLKMPPGNANNFETVYYRI